MTLSMRACIVSRSIFRAKAASCRPSSKRSPPSSWTKLEEPREVYAHLLAHKLRELGLAHDSHAHAASDDGARGFEELELELELRSGAVSVAGGAPEQEAGARTGAGSGRAKPHLASVTSFQKNTD